MIYVDVLDDAADTFIFLIDVYDGVEQCGDATVLDRYRRHHRHAEQSLKFTVIQNVSLFFQLVVHIQGNHHLKVHVDELGGQEEVPFQVGRIHNIQYHVRLVVDYGMADIFFLRAVSGNGIGSREVYQRDAVTLVVHLAPYGIHGYPAVVAHPLVASAGAVEQAGLSAVRVSYQSYRDFLALFPGTTI